MADIAAASHISCLDYVGDVPWDDYPADAWAELEPVYESFPGWSESSRGITRMEDLPVNAQSYLGAMEELCGAPVHIVSTGPDRSENIILQYPFDL